MLEKNNIWHLDNLHLVRQIKHDPDEVKQILPDQIVFIFNLH